jgi:hypothetical protein
MVRHIFYLKVNYVRKKIYTTATWEQHYKTILSVIYDFSLKARAFVRQGLKSLPGTNTLVYYKIRKLRQ